KGPLQQGSGALVDFKHCLTAAHLLYRPELGGYAKKVVVIPGQNGANFKPFGTYLKTQIRYYPGWYNKTTKQYNWDNDFALITLNKAGPAAFGFEFLSDEVVNKLVYSQGGYLLNTAGYPGDKSRNGVFMYQGNGRMTGLIDGQQFSFTSIATAKGQSG